MVSRDGHYSQKKKFENKRRGKAWAVNAQARFGLLHRATQDGVMLIAKGDGRGAEKSRKGNSGRI